LLIVRVKKTAVVDELAGAHIEGGIAKYTVGDVRLGNIHRNKIVVYVRTQNPADPFNIIEPDGRVRRWQVIPAIGKGFVFVAEIVSGPERKFKTLVFGKQRHILVRQ